MLRVGRYRLVVRAPLKGFGRAMSSTQLFFGNGENRPISAMTGTGNSSVFRHSLRVLKTHTFWPNAGSGCERRSDARKSRAEIERLLDLDLALTAAAASAFEQNLVTLPTADRLFRGPGVTLISTPLRHETSPHSVHRKWGCSAVSPWPFSRSSKRQTWSPRSSRETRPDSLSSIRLR